LLRRVVCITTNIGSDHWDLVDGSKGKHGSYGPLVVWPIANIVTKPVANLLTCARKCAASDDNRSVRWTTIQHGSLRSS
jgi:hypothetical protein